MFVFNNTEEEWFCSWVVMRRKFIKSQENVRELIKDVNYWRNKSYELEKTNSDLLKDKKNQIATDIEIKEANKRIKMVEQFNIKHNKQNNYKKRKKRNL